MTKVTEVRWADTLLKWLILHGSDWVDIREVWGMYKLSALEGMGFVERKVGGKTQNLAYNQYKLTDKAKQLINRGLQNEVSDG